MDHFCEECVKPIITINHTIDNPEFGDIDKIYEDHTNKNKKSRFQSYQVLFQTSFLQF